jgi:hypothetical protein
LPRTPFVLWVHSGVRGLRQSSEELAHPRLPRGSRFAGGRESRQHEGERRPSDTAQDASVDLNTVPCVLSQDIHDSSFDINCPGTRRAQGTRAREETTRTQQELDATLVLRHLHAMRRQRRRVAMAPISAMRRIHGTWSFATLLPEGPGAVRSQRRPPLALQKRCQSRPQSRNLRGGFWICTPTAGPFAGSHLSSIRPGQQTPCSQPDANQAHASRPRRCVVCGTRKSELRPAVFCHCGAADGVCAVCLLGLGIPRLRLRDRNLRSALGKPCLSPPFLEARDAPASRLFTSWKESLSFAASLHRARIRKLVLERPRFSRATTRLGFPLRRSQGAGNRLPCPRP